MYIFCNFSKFGLHYVPSCMFFMIDIYTPPNLENSADASYNTIGQNVQESDDYLSGERIVFSNNNMI